LALMPSLLLTKPGQIESNDWSPYCLYTIFSGNNG
jgi:hypothetical protein